MPMNIEYVGDFFAYFVIAFGAIILSKYLHLLHPVHKKRLTDRIFLFVSSFSRQVSLARLFSGQYFRQILCLRFLDRFCDRFLGRTES